MKKLNEALEWLFSDNTLVIDTIHKALEGRIESLGESPTVEYSCNSSIGDVVIRGDGVIRVGRDENQIVIGGHGNPILEKKEILHLPVDNLPQWNLDWCSKIERLWLEVFSAELKKKNSKIIIESSDGESVYEFSLNGHIYYSRIKGNSNYSAGAFMYDPGKKLLSRESTDVLEELGNNVLITEVMGRHNNNKTKRKTN